MIYRVVLEIGYCNAYFDFQDSRSAASFAEKCLIHQVASEKTMKKPSITMLVIDKSIKEREEN